MKRKTDPPAPAEPQDGPLVPFDDLFPRRDEPIPPDPEEGPLVPFEDLITDTGEPVDSIFIEKQQRLMTQPLHCSWPGPGPGRSFLVCSNVGLFPDSRQATLVPDIMLGVDVKPGEDLTKKENRSWFVWVLGKVPDAVVEFVSDRRGGEGTYKFRKYAQLTIPYYVIFDPEHWLSEDTLRAFALRKGAYKPLRKPWFPKVKLGVTLWQGTFEGHATEWLRWCDANGVVIPTGSERAEEKAREAEQERQRRKRLEARLRSLGIDPTDNGAE